MEKIRAAIDNSQWVMSRHAREQAGKRYIEDIDLLSSLIKGEILEDYPDDPRGASMLILGRTDEGNALHTMCSFDVSGTLVIITVYEPEQPRWIDERTRGGKL
jgi:hypothetical protein